MLTKTEEPPPQTQNKWTQMVENDRNSHFSALEIQSELASQVLQSFWTDTFSLLRIVLPPVTSQDHAYFCHIFCFPNFNA